MKKIIITEEQYEKVFVKEQFNIPLNLPGVPSVGDIFSGIIDYFVDDVDIIPDEGLNPALPWFNNNYVDDTYTDAQFMGLGYEGAMDILLNPNTIYKDLKSFYNNVVNTYPQALEDLINDILILSKEVYELTIGKLKELWDNCDYHCWLDIASIAVLLIPPPVGIIASGVIDVVNAGMYLFADEDSPAWGNAFITLLGVIPVAKPLKMLKSKVVMKPVIELSQELGKAVYKYGKNLPDGVYKEIIEKVFKGKSEKQIKNIGLEMNRLSKGLDSQGMKALENSLKQYKELSKFNQNLLKDKVFTNKDFQEILIRNSGDAMKSIKEFRKGPYWKAAKLDAVFQGSLFIALYVYAEEIGEYVLGPIVAGGAEALYQTTGFDYFCQHPEDTERWAKWNTKYEKNCPSASEVGNITQDIKKLQNKREGLQLSNAPHLKKLEKEAETRNYFLMNIYESYKNVIKLIKPYKNKIELGPQINEAYVTTISIVERVGVDTSVFRQLSEIWDKFYKSEKFWLENPNADESNYSTYFIQQLTFGMLSLQGELNKFKRKPIMPAEDRVIKVTLGEDYDKEKLQEELKSVIDMEELPNELNEELYRIKSMFTDERLYGNLIKEACDDCSDAINFITSNTDCQAAVKQQTWASGTQPTKQNECLAPGYSLRSVYEKYRDQSGLKISVNPGANGCTLKIVPSGGVTRGKFRNISLFEKGSNLRFVAYYMLNDNTATRATNDAPLGAGDVIETTLWSATNGAGKTKKAAFRAEAPYDWADIGTTLATHATDIINTTKSPKYNTNEYDYIGVNLSYVRISGRWSYNGADKTVTLVPDPNGTGLVDRYISEDQSKIDPIVNIEYHKHGFNIDSTIDLSGDMWNVGGAAGTVTQFLTGKFTGIESGKDITLHDFIKNAMKINIT